MTNETNSTKRKLVTVVVGRGKAVHYAFEGRSSALCGSGNCTTGMRARYAAREVVAEVTCAKCIKKAQRITERN